MRTASISAYRRVWVAFIGRTLGHFQGGDWTEPGGAPLNKMLIAACVSSNALRPQCEDRFVAVVRDGSWACVDRNGGAERPEPPVDCVPDGGRRAVRPNAPPCCEGLASIGCDLPSTETGGMRRPGCVGASYCTACGNGVCGEGENDCNCPADCPAP